jgi:hypothetical protein
MQHMDSAESGVFRHFGVNGSSRVDGVPRKRYASIGRVR